MTYPGVDDGASNDSSHKKTPSPAGNGVNKNRGIRGEGGLSIQHERALGAGGMSKFRLLSFSRNHFHLVTHYLASGWVDDGAATTKASSPHDL
jgi:hypothetical protein